MTGMKEDPGIISLRSVPPQTLCWMFRGVAMRPTRMSYMKSIMLTATPSVGGCVCVCGHCVFVFLAFARDGNTCFAECWSRNSCNRCRRLTVQAQAYLYVHGCGILQRREEKNACMYEKSSILPYHRDQGQE